MGFGLSGGSCLVSVVEELEMSDSEFFGEKVKAGNLVGIEVCSKGGYAVFYA